MLVRRPGAGPRRAGPRGGCDRGADRRGGGTAAVPGEAQHAPVDRRGADDGGRGPDRAALVRARPPGHIGRTAGDLPLTDALALSGLTKTFGAKRAVDDLS